MILGRYWVLWGALLVLGFLVMISGTQAPKPFLQDGEVDSLQAGHYELANTINPNEAGWASLARLPGIGRGKARAIVNYRQDYQARHGSESIAFARADDLVNVRGVGEVTVERVRSYLIFDVQ